MAVMLLEHEMKYGLHIFLASLAGMAGYGLGGAHDDAPSAPLAAPKDPGVRAEGRVTTLPGAWVTLSAERPGRLAWLNCQEQLRLRQGEKVAVLDRNEGQAAVAESRAQVAAAEAELKLAEAEVRRARDLAARGFYSQQGVDRSEQTLAVASARLASATATTRRLEAVLDKTVLIAPISGTVVDRLANVGETLTMGQGLCSIADLGQMRVEAEVDEFDAGRVQVGGVVHIVAEGYTGEEWQGRVEEIPDAVRAPRLRPRDPAKPVDTRVLLVRIVPSAPLPLKLGQRVEVRIGRL